MENEMDWINAKDPNDREPITGNAPPEMISNYDRITLMRDDLERIRRGYGGMLYFCSRITGYPEDQITMLMLKQFEIVRWHDRQQEIKNHAFPVGYYLEQIKRLEEENALLHNQQQ